jgi:hypothetical protein
VPHVYNTQAPVRELYERVLGYDGDDCFAEVLSRWLGQNPAEVTWLADVAAKDQGAWHPTDEEICRLYAFSRVNDLLLLSFQPPPRETWPGPRLSLEQYRAFLVGLGMQVIVEARFHPLFHEIVAVEPGDPEALIELVRESWPCSMLGTLVFSRAGTIVRGGAREIVPAIASSSTLYWAHRRHHRRVEDLALGWGSNSQWRTRFRRDYVTPSAWCFNADGKWDLREPVPVDLHPGRDELSVEQRIELLTHRCFVRTELRHDDRWPYDDRLTMPRT